MMTAWSFSGRPQASKGTPSPARRRLAKATRARRRAVMVVEYRRLLVDQWPRNPSMCAQARTEALGGLGGVLGDVASHLLSRQLPGLAIVAGDVAHVELLAPAGIPLRPPIDGRAGHPDGRDRLPEGVLEEGGREWLRWWGQAARAAAGGGRVQANDRVEVDRPAPLELSHLGVRHADQPAQLPLLEADQPAQGTLEGDGGPPPQLGGQGVPQHLRLAVVAGRAERLAQPGIVGVVTVPAAIADAMRAAGALPVRMTG